MSDAEPAPKSLLIPGTEILDSVQEVYERGRTVDALRRAEAFAPLTQWAGAKPCVLAARLAANSGAPRLATRLTLRAWNTDPQDPQVLVQYGHEVLVRRGALALWRLLRPWRTGGPDAAAEHQADLLALQGIAASDLRDFATAEQFLDGAESLAPHRPWIRLQRAHLLERLDRVEEALAVATAACGLHPHPYYRPGVQICAHLLQLLDRDEEAIRLLSAAGVALQNGVVAVQLYGLLSENDRWSEAETALDRYVTFSPLLERPLQRWVTAQRARAAYHLGRRADAARFASELPDDFHRRFCQKLSDPQADAERVQLDVTFVRQHFKTCAPATLAALGRFWRMPAEHLKLAEAMCYDGTPHWEQRRWARDNGWIVREFRVTHESAVALIAKGIPFAISVVEATSAHMMALIGFDRVRNTLLLRDPGQPYLVEAAVDEFLERYRPFGPHGMVFVPAAERARLDGLDLPDVAIYDEYHELCVALVRHDRPSAVDTLRRMESVFGDQALTWEARLDLASYDANLGEQARCLDQLLGLFPGSPPRVLRRYGCLRDGTREERIRFLEQACAAKERDSVFFIELARALEGDARCLPQARNALRRAMCRRPLDANAMGVQADLCWEEGNLDEATELYRFAANLEGFRESLYESWFVACRRTRRTEEAMAHLQDRFARFGRRSDQPALTLAWAWREMEQPGRAREVLDAAARLRPDDGGLLLRSASLFASLGDDREADRLLQAAKGKVREREWLRTAAEMAEFQLDIAAALRWAREILRLEPLALDAHAGAARALARLEGPAAVLAHLRDACTRFPHHYGLQRMLVEWDRDADPATAEADARELLRLAPSDAWARRELAVVLLKAKRYDEAMAEATEAARIEPRNSYSISLLGHVHRSREQWPEARAQFRQAVELSVDNDDALHALLSLAKTDAERREELEFVERQLIQQVVAGDGVLAFLELARPVLEPEAVLRSAREAHAARPDLWHAWAALVSQLGHVNRLDEALEIARQATQRFPHLPRAWLDLATVHQWRGEAEAEVSAAERAFEINPAWDRSALALTDAFERQGRLDDARRVYERALQHQPRCAQLHACRAHLLWRKQQQAAAFAALERALRLAPAYDWAWALMLSWAGDCGEAERPGDFARALARERSGEPRVWLMLARVLSSPAALPERLAAVDRALGLETRCTEAWDAKAELLACDERFDDAIQACHAGAAACSLDVYLLRGRQAWIEARRRRLSEAVRLMRAVLAEHASYAWGWNQLAQWLVEQGELAEATWALERLRRLHPHDAWVNRQLGLLRVRQGDAAGAQEAFAEGLRLDPTDAVSAHHLFDLQVQADDLPGAAATLRQMQTHQPGAATLAEAVRLHLRQGQHCDAIQALEALCRTPDPDAWPVDTAAAAFDRARWSSRALRVFKRALKRRSCNPQVAATVVSALLSRRKDHAAARVFLRLEAGEPQRRAAAPLIHGLGDLKSGLLLRWVLWRRRDVLMADDTAWGQVGYALSQLNHRRAVARWLADWRTRRDVQPWMLFNLCLALRHLGRYDEANTVARHVIESWGHREGSADLHLFLAVEDALAGSLAAAQEHLRLVVIRENVAHDQELLALAKALVEFQQAPSGERLQRFRAIRGELGRRFSCWRMLHLLKDVRRTFRRCGEVCGRAGGGWRAQWWFGWRLHWQWSLVPLAPVMLPILLLPPVWIALWLWQTASERRR